VLATRDGCTADVCDAFGLVYDDKKLRANLKDRLFDVTVARYAVNWPIRTRPLASGGPTGAPGPNVTFPSAQSIPPVSPTTAEPAASPSAVAQEPASSAPTNSAPASATKRPPAPPKAVQKSAAPPPMSLNPTAKQ
jgi:hypothetical protein